MNKLYVVGIGPGNRENMTLSAVNALKDSNIIIGYDTYIDLIKDLIIDKEIVSNGMRKEVDRCKEAIVLASKGNTVSVVSSGDAGVYGMAGLILEIISKEYSLSEFDVQVIPGVTAGNSSAAILGAPLMHDYVTISLSDWLTKWETIENRLHCAGKGDFIVVLYNPKSKSRTEYIKKTQEILLNYKSPQTPVGIVKSAFRDDQNSQITTLKQMVDCDIDMFSTVIIGNSNTFVDGEYIITPRGYSI
ncbi:precorrin-3B C(17)-methyltransferase [Alkalibaculum sp. M08DMB]|uniref:Precorrin-3B C(17)-methyltransferase n=1 Tax=Alkalibaculum sporogenes TaxID=2655001 RepID=A0A6A7K9X0_9FIRM|nr:precorrin-3B C(17)-methyltransferase [Alkalibaculum sporogenes]MPW26288.1 precorrin-3B C(17)-methyltransferase [Alkalibaculum sporogenes]